MKNLIYVVLGLVMFYFVCAELGRTPEGDLAKYMEKKYNKEFAVDIYSRYGDLYEATLYPKEFEGTLKEKDKYYEVIGSIQNDKVTDKVKENYINVILQDQINEFYLPKLKELFGENVLPIFKIEGECKKDNFQEEIARRMELYKEDPNKHYDPLIGNIYIFGKVKNNKEKEIYREKIFKFIEYMRETNTFEYTGLSIDIIDDESFKENTYEVILEKEIEKIEEDTKDLKEMLIRDSRNPIVELTITDENGQPRRADDQGIERATEIIEINQLTKLVTEKGIIEENFKDLKTILKSIRKCDADYIFNKYGKVLLSTNIASPKRAEYSNRYWGTERYINLYERKEDICFKGEEQNYPNGTIKELGEKFTYYITETKNNKKNGISTRYNSNDKVIWVGTYKDNMLNGPFKEYEEKWIEEGTYKNNLLDGEVKWTRYDGEVRTMIYKNGVEQKNQEE